MRRCSIDCSHRWRPSLRLQRPSRSGSPISRSSSSPGPASPSGLQGGLRSGGRLARRPDHWQNQGPGLAPLCRDCRACRAGSSIPTALQKPIGSHWAKSHSDSAAIVLRDRQIHSSILIQSLTSRTKSSMRGAVHLKYKISITISLLPAISAAYAPVARHAHMQA